MSASLRSRSVSRSKKAAKPTPVKPSTSKASSSPQPASELIFPGPLLALGVLAVPLYLGWELLGTGAGKWLPTSAVVGALSFLATAVMVPVISRYNARKGLTGMDLNKRGLPGAEVPVPETLGIVPGIVFLVAVISFSTYRVWVAPEPVRREYDTALTSVCFMLFLGFIDDVLDIPWRYKLVLPLFASMPLLASYSGATTVIVPSLPPFLRSYLGGAVELGALYHLYMALLAIFCTNSINIYAGINGLEAGQAFVIGASVLTHNLLEMRVGNPVSLGPHLFSMTLMFPFLGATLGLLYHNWYPSKVFVGDSFTYFAGIVLAVCGILGHFSKSLLLFFIPQVINFLLSLPQLIGIIPCPRHRLPKLNVETGLLEGVPTHLNLVNQSLILLGPQSERRLAVILMAFQVVCSALAFYIRYPIARLLFE